jgi:hypothetical protein
MVDIFIFFEVISSGERLRTPNYILKGKAEADFPENRLCPTFLIFTGLTILSIQFIISMRRTILRDLNSAMRKGLKDPL